MKKRRFVVAMTGASGAAYGVRLVEVLGRLGAEVHLSVSPAAACVIEQELGRRVDLVAFAAEDLLPADVSGSREKGSGPCSRPTSQPEDKVGWPRNGPDPGLCSPPGDASPWFAYHRHDDLMAPLASGSFLTDGMVVCPCSASTLAAIVHGTATNLIHRAAEVHLKERRPLILVPRETPLSLVQLTNLKRAAELGAIVLPASPGFYHRPQRVEDLVDFVVARICDQLGLEHTVAPRWGEPREEGNAGRVER